HLSALPLFEARPTQNRRSWQQMAASEVSPRGPGPTGIPPTLPFADGIACCALNGPQTPRLVTGAPRATILPLWFQSTHTLPLPTAIEGWSMLPVPTVSGALNVTPPSVLKITLIWLTLLLM